MGWTTIRYGFAADRQAEHKRLGLHK